LFFSFFDLLARLSSGKLSKNKRLDFHGNEIALQPIWKKIALQTSIIHCNAKLCQQMRFHYLGWQGNNSNFFSTRLWTDYTLHKTTNSLLMTRNNRLPRRNSSGVVVVAEI
jgi:hypothetical protein